MLCHFCQHSIQFQDKINREETCIQCGKYIHCCFNCRFYHPDAHHQCKEPVAEWVRDKEIANFCDYFEPNEKKISVNPSGSAEARKKLDQLFKKSSS